FLVIVLLVDGWRLSPLAAAGVATAMPVGAVAGRFVGQSTWAGIVLLAAGLVGLGLLPAATVGWVIGALLLCGVGTGMALPRLTSAALDGAPGAGLSVGIRHAGLVLAIVLITPLLVSSLAHGTERAKLLGTADILDAPLPIRTKVPLAFELIR